MTDWSAIERIGWVLWGFMCLAAAITLVTITGNIGLKLLEIGTGLLLWWLPPLISEWS